MSMTSEGVRPARRREKRRLETLSVFELCEEIREAPAYDAAAGVSMRTLVAAYERLRCVAVELAGWIEGDSAPAVDGKNGSEGKNGKKGGREV